jgi:Cys-rich repeat protein
MNRILFASFLLVGSAGAGLAEPTVGETRVLGPFTGPQAKLHPDNVEPIPIRYYGTDLGWTYEHEGTLHILFGDTMANEEGEKIEASSGDRLDDSFGTIDLDKWSDPASFSAANMPLIRLGQNAGTDEMSAIDPDHAMEGFKTPVGGFSNGEQEFGLFYLAKPEGCRADADCMSGFSCDPGLGYVGEKYTNDAGLTLACVEGSSEACMADTMDGTDSAPSGLCVDPTSTIWADTGIGRVGAAVTKIRIGLRDAGDPRKYEPLHDWLTNKFLNLAIRTVTDPDTGKERVYIWGRPSFIGVNATGRTAGVYFAYTEMPLAPDFAWNLRYFTGVDETGAAQFGSRETDAAALDLDSSRDGVQADERYDIVNQHSVAWIGHLNKWVMFYGGGTTNLTLDPWLPRCGVLELFTGSECTEVDMDNGAFRMRTADNPWGPWSPPQDILVGGDPSVPGSGQYGEGGMLRHPSCTASTCAPHTAARDVNADEYGFFYSANIIEQWTRPVGDSVDVIWNASTWDPYRVILLRTRIDPK